MGIPQPRKKKSNISKLKRKLDLLHTIWVKEKENNRCITCGKFCEGRDRQAGHFISRNFNMTRWHPMNVNIQCGMRCNMYGHGEQYTYSIKIDEKYGEGTAKELYKLAHRNNYQDEALTIQRLIEALQNKEDYPAVYEEVMAKYLSTVNPSA